MAYPTSGRDLSATTINKWLTTDGGPVDCAYANNAVLDTLKETGKNQGKRGVPQQKSAFRTLDGGEFVQDTPLLVKSGASTNITGDEVITAVQTDPFKKAIWPLCMKVKIVTISEFDKMRNSGSEKMVDEEQGRITEGMSRLMYDVNYDICTQDYATGVSSYTGVNGLPKLINSSGTSDTDVIAGITRANSTIPGWCNQASTSVGAFKTYYTTLTTQRAVCDGANKGARWNLLLTTPTIWAAILNKYLSLGQVQLQNDKDPDTGYQSFRWLGAKVVMDQDITAGYIYGIPTEDMWFAVNKNHNFKVGEAYDAQVQMVTARKMSFAGNIGFRRFNGCGVTTGWS